MSTVPPATLVPVAGEQITVPTPVCVRFLPPLDIGDAVYEAQDYTWQALSRAFRPGKDEGLKALDCDHLFPAQTTRLAFKRGAYLRGRECALEAAHRFAAVSVRRRSLSIARRTSSSCTS